jgi:hypothetical protein
VFADNHFFELFWAPLQALPEIVSPQDRYLDALWAAGDEMLGFARPPRGTAREDLPERKG